MNRRSFVGNLSVAGLGMVAGGRAFGAEERAAGREIAVFTKGFEKLGFNEFAAAIAPLGVDGIEATLRKGGHIEPEKLEEELPVFTEALAEKGLKTIVMASSINSVDGDGLAEKQLRAAAKAGIRKYRLEHLKYDLSKPIKPQMANFKARLEDLAALNRETGMQGLYQNHRGNDYVGGPVWDMVAMLEDIDPAHLGMAFDFAHATVEGANAWELNFRRALPHIGAVFFKDYKLVGRKWSPCPIGEGVVKRAAGKLVSEMLPTDIPISIHVEYARAGNSVEKALEAMANDVEKVRKWLG